jgi:hypothetical protein
MEQVLTHRARLKTYPFNRIWKRAKARSDVADLTRQLALKQYDSLAINNAKCTGSQRYVYSGKIFHF